MLIMLIYVNIIANIERMMMLIYANVQRDPNANLC